MFYPNGALNSLPVRSFFMNIHYSIDIDRNIHTEVNTKGKKLSLIFGFAFLPVIFDKEKSQRAAKLAKQVSVFDEKKAQNTIFSIYRKKLPKISLFINTTSFSTWNVHDKYISLSLDRFPNDVLSSFCHEANHFMYDVMYENEKYTDTEIKETVTVLNELFGIKDKGWHVFDEQRHKVLEYAKQTHDCLLAIKYAQQLFKKDE